MKVGKKLETWLDHQLINKEQYQAILAFEGEHSSKEHWIIYGFLILGAVTTGIGIISLIANNWAAIPAVVKLSADFLLLGVLAIGIYRLFDSEHANWLDVLITSFLLLCLASIGLISQIYHIKGEIFHALLLWSTITFGVVLYARKYFPPFLWTTLFIIGLSWSVLDMQSQLIGHKSWWSDTNPLSLLFIFTIFSCLLFAYIGEYFRRYAFTYSFRFWFAIAGIASLIYADIMYWTSSWEGTSFALMIPAYLVTAMFIGYILQHKSLPVYNRILIIAASVLYLLLFHPEWVFLNPDRSDSLLAELFAPVLIISVLLLFALHVGSMGRKTLFNIATFLVGLRFLVVYFEVIGDLAMTGIGLIISGLVIIAVTYGWYKTRERLQQWALSLRDQA
jgi:uncharacterized membrane protein